MEGSVFFFNVKIIWEHFSLLTLIFHFEYLTFNTKTFYQQIIIVLHFLLPCENRFLVNAFNISVEFVFTASTDTKCVPINALFNFVKSLKSHGPKSI